MGEPLALVSMAGMIVEMELVVSGTQRLACTVHDISESPINTVTPFH